MKAAQVLAPGLVAAVLLVDLSADLEPAGLDLEPVGSDSDLVGSDSDLVELEPEELVVDLQLYLFCFFCFSFWKEQYLFLKFHGHLV